MLLNLTLRINLNAQDVNGMTHFDGMFCYQIKYKGIKK